MSRAALQVGSARITTGNSSPLALCTVITRTPSVPSSTIGASSASPRSASASSFSTKARKEEAPALEAPRHVDQPQAVGERLLAGRPKRDAGVRAHGFEQHGDRLGDRAVVAPDVKPPQELQRVGDLDARQDRAQSGRSACIGWRRRVFSSAVDVDILPESEERLVAEREERPAQRRKDPELVVGPFDRGEGVAQRDDLLAIVERAPAHEHVRDAPRLQRADVGPRDVRAEIAEPAEEDGDVARPDRRPRCPPPRPSSRSRSTSQSTKAPTASGSDSSIRQLTMLP